MLNRCGCCHGVKHVPSENVIIITVTLKDGTLVDSGTTTYSPVQVIKGWTEVMQLMGEGDKWRMYIPSNLAYGVAGSEPTIPPHSPLTLELEIHKVKSTKGKHVTDARRAFANALDRGSEEL